MTSTVASEGELGAKVEALYRQGRAGKACRKSKQAVERFPSSKPLLYQHAEITLSLGRLSEAKSVIKALLRIDPDWANTSYIAGVEALLDKRPAEARSYFEKTLRLNPCFYQARKFLADACLDSGDLKAAGEIIEEELSKHSSDPSMANHIGGVVCSKAALIARTNQSDARKEIVTWLKRLHHDQCLIIALRELNPAADSETKHYSVEVTGEAPIMSFSPQSKSCFCGNYEVAANSKAEALEFIKEIEGYADPASLIIAKAIKRGRATSRQKGVIVAYPSFSMECAPAASAAVRGDKQDVFVH